MRKDWPSIYERVLQKLLEQGTPEEEAIPEARARADEIYYYLVDRGRQEAKDREPREPIPPGGDDVD